MTELRRAIHETGHAALAFEMGIGVQYVTITEANGRWGFCEYESGLNQRLEYEFAYWGERYAIVMLGGMEAEKRFLRENGMAEVPLHALAWSEDIRLVTKAIACMMRDGIMVTGDPDSELARLVAEAGGRVQDERIWAGINAVAAALAAEQTLSGARAEDLYRKAKEPAA
jgi:hypothetical protein